MKQSYLKYIETTEMIDEGPTAGLTRLQHVGVVAVLDENGDEWFPDTEVPEPIEPLEVATESFYDESNVYKWGEVISATTATFKGGEEPYSIWARGRYRLAGEDKYKDTPKVFYENEDTKVSFTIPVNTDKIGFFTACNDSQNPTSTVYVNSTLPVKDVLGLDPKIIAVVPQSLIQIEAGKRIRLDCYVEVNYTALYYWQFNLDGVWKMSSDLQYYYPDSLFLVSEGHNTMSYQYSWVDGDAPTEWRCMVKDKYDVNTSKTVYSPTYQLAYPSLSFEEQEFYIVEYPKFEKSEGAYGVGTVLTATSLGEVSLASTPTRYFWMGLKAGRDPDDLSSYSSRSSDKDYVVDDYDIKNGMSWRLRVDWKSNEQNSDGTYKFLKAWSDNQSFI